MHLLQVGVGSGGIVVLDLLAREPAVTRVTVVDPDVYSAHNVHRHLFERSGIGRRKVDLAADWLCDRRFDLPIAPIVADITDPAFQANFGRLAAACDVGVCAADNEPAKYAFDAEMRKQGKPWTLGEVLSGGIGGWVHWFVPGGPCYGCVASHLQRTVAEAPAGPWPDYSNPGSTAAATTVPASRASIHAIAALHADLTLELLKDTSAAPQPAATAADGSAAAADGSAAGPFTSLLVTLRSVPGVFDEAYRTYRFRIPRAAGCLVCSTPPACGLPTPGTFSMWHWTKRWIDWLRNECAPARRGRGGAATRFSSNIK